MYSILHQQKILRDIDQGFCTSSLYLIEKSSHTNICGGGTVVEGNSGEQVLTQQEQTNKLAQPIIPHII